MARSFNSNFSPCPKRAWRWGPAETGKRRLRPSDGFAITRGPAAEKRGRSGKYRREVTPPQFLRSHWSTLAASDFFSTEVWTPKGIVTIYTLFIIKLETRRVHIVGSTPHPDSVFMKQTALDLAAFDDGFLRGTTHMIVDRDTKFTAEFEEVLADNGVKIVKDPRSLAKLQSTRRAVCEEHQDGVLEQDDLLRVQVARQC